MWSCVCVREGGGRICACERAFLRGEREVVVSMHMKWCAFVVRGLGSCPYMQEGMCAW